MRRDAREPRLGPRQGRGMIATVLDAVLMLIALLILWLVAGIAVAWFCGTRWDRWHGRHRRTRWTREIGR